MTSLCLFPGFVSCASLYSSLFSQSNPPDTYKQGEEGVLVEETDREGGKKAASECDSQRGNSTCCLQLRFNRQNSSLPVLVMDSKVDKEERKEAQTKSKKLLIHNQR